MAAHAQKYSKPYIREVFYDSPLNEIGWSTTSVEKRSHNGEYIEIHNPSDFEISLERYSLKGTNNWERYAFPDYAVIPAKGYVLVVFSRDKFRISNLFKELEREDSGLTGKQTIFYHNKIVLYNAGEIIQLIDEQGYPIDWMTYGKFTERYSANPVEPNYKQLFAHNGLYPDGVYNTAPRSLHRTSIVVDSYGNHTFDVHSWQHSEVTPLGYKINQTTIKPEPTPEPEPIFKKHNYIHIRSMMTESGEFIDQIQYFDGIGRPSQAIQVGFSPLKNDLVILQEYDDFGREGNSWLPISIQASNNGAYVGPTAIKRDITTSSLYNKDVAPYSKPIYEASPLNRIIEQYGPGNEWQNRGKSVKTFYLTNKGGVVVQKSITMDEKDTQKGILSGVYPSCESITLKPGFQFKSTEEKSLHLYTDPSLCVAPKTLARSVPSTPTIRDEFLTCTLYGINNEQLSKNNSYKAGELYVTLIIDEDDNQSLEFKDKLGQVVLTRQINGSEKYDTYFVYDDFGNLRYVLPPLAIDKLTKYVDSDPIMKQYAYIYKYDNRNRCTWKKLPGVEPTLYIYDKADQLIFAQDGEHKVKGEWLFTISDALGRNVVNGTVKGNTEIKAGMWDNTTTAPIVKANYTGSAINLGYQITGFIFTPTTLISANFYDNYEFLGENTVPNSIDTQYTSEAGYGVCYGNHTDKVKSKGLLTGALTAQLPSGTMLYSVMYYDNRGRLIQTKSNNHLVGGVEKEYIAYNFVGQPTKKKHVHTATGQLDQTEIYAYTYDHAGRLIDTKHKLNAGAETLIAHNEYDELGRLKTNKKGNDKSDNLKTTYDYNIRSWTSKISSPLFTQNLYYNTAPLASSVSPQYGGNISAMSWQVEKETERKYGFTYDGLSGLTHAAYDYGSGGSRFEFWSCYLIMRGLYFHLTLFCF